MPTCDVIIAVKDCIQSHVDRGQFVIAISLDVANAFNSVPWRSIKETLRRKEFPKYIVDDMIL